MIMGKGICSNDYVGNRKAQELFRREMGGSSELPMDIQRRLDSLKRRKKKSPRAGQKGN